MIVRHSHCLHLRICPYLPQSRQQQKRSTETPAVIQVVSHNRGSYNHKGRQFMHCAMGRPHYFTQGLELVQRAGGSGCMADEDCSKIPPGGPNAKPKKTKRGSTLHLYLIPWDKTCIQNVENSKTLTDQKLANDATPHGLQGQMTGSTYLATTPAVPKRKNICQTTPVIIKWLLPGTLNPVAEPQAHGGQFLHSFIHPGIHYRTPSGQSLKLLEFRVEVYGLWRSGLSPKASKL